VNFNKALINYKPLTQKRGFAVLSEEERLRESGATLEEKQYWEKAFASVPDPTYLSLEQRSKINWISFEKYRSTAPKPWENGEIAPGVKFWQWRKLLGNATEDYYMFDFKLNPGKQYKRYVIKGWFGDLKKCI